MGHTTIRPGDRITASLPGIACDFQAEIIEIQQLNGPQARVYVRALEPVIGYSEPAEELYPPGSLIWLTIRPPEGFTFGEEPEIKDIPPLIGFVDDALA
jgi:hypothetical protein